MTTEPVSNISIEDLVEAFLEEIREGAQPTIQSYTERYPQLADEIAELFPVVAAMEGWKDQETTAKGGRNSLGGVTIERLGDFRMVREIGRGGMGIVFEAVQESLNRCVAIKILPPTNVKSNDGTGERFRREAQTAAALHHSNIVPVFGIGCENGFNYIVMQLIDGCGLDTMLRSQAHASTRTRRHLITERIDQQLSTHDHGTSESNPLLDSHGKGMDPRFVAKLGIQAADAIHYAHENGILHRDIKPANMLMDKKGHLWIADFGLAKALEHQTLSRSSDIVGTLLYMAPERLRGRCDARSDVYSLGVTLLELITGRPVFEPRDSGALIERISKGFSGRGGDIPKWVPLDLKTILIKSISVDPGDRYQTAQEFADDLRAFVSDRPIKARQASRFEEFRRTCRRNPIVTALSASVLGLLLLTAVVTTAGLIQQRMMRNRTEATLDTTLRSLDKIYTNFANPSGDAAEALVSGAILSDETAAMLTELLTVYDELASQGADSGQLERESINAQLRVADIHTRLGRLKTASDNYENAILRMDQLRFQSDREKAEWALRRAQTLLSWSSSKELMGEYAEATSLRQQAMNNLVRLQSVEPANDEIELAMARLHYLTGKASRQFSVADYDHLFTNDRFDGRPPGRREHARGHEPWDRKGPPGLWDALLFSGPPPLPADGLPEKTSTPIPIEDSKDQLTRQMALNAAIDSLSRIDVDSALAVRAKLLHALTLREMASLASTTEEIKTARLNESLELLQGLADQFPDNAEFQLQLARTLMQAVEQNSTDSVWALEQKESYLLRAVSMLEDLHKRQPQIPEYTATLAQLSELLGLVSKELADRGMPNQRGSRMMRAEEMLRNAVVLQQSRISSGHDDWTEQLWLLRFRIALTLVTSGRSEPWETKQQLDDIRSELNALNVPEESESTRLQMLESLEHLPPPHPQPHGPNEFDGPPRHGRPGGPEGRGGPLGRGGPRGEPPRE